MTLLLLPSVRSKQEWWVRRGGVGRKGARSRAGWSGALLIVLLLGVGVAGGSAGDSGNKGGSSTGGGRNSGGDSSVDGDSSTGGGCSTGASSSTGGGSSTAGEAGWQQVSGALGGG